MTAIRVLHALHSAHRETTVEFVTGIGDYFADIEFINVLTTRPDQEPAQIVVFTYDVLALRSSILWPLVESRLLAFADQAPRVVLLPQDDYTLTNVLHKLILRLRPERVHLGSSLYHSDMSLYESFPRDVTYFHARTSYTSEVKVSRAQSRFVPHERREYAFSNRVSYLDPTFGDIGQRKAMANRKLVSALEDAGLNTNYSDARSSVLYGADWQALLQASRYTLGTASGSSIADLNGRLARMMRRRGEESVVRLIRRHQYLARRGVQTSIRFGGFTADSPRLLDAILAGTALLFVESSAAPKWLSEDQHYLQLHPLSALSSGGHIAFLQSVSQSQALALRALNQVANSPHLMTRHLAHSIAGYEGTSLLRPVARSFRASAWRLELDDNHTDATTLWRAIAKAASDCRLSHASDIRQAAIQLQDLCMATLPSLEGRATADRLEGLVLSIASNDLLPVGIVPAFPLSVSE